MGEAPCGLIIRAAPQVPYSLTAVLYKFCHLVKTVRNADPPLLSNRRSEAHSLGPPPPGRSGRAREATRPVSPNCSRSFLRG